MSREHDFHKLIRQQNSKDKEDLWNRIQQQPDEEEIDLGNVIVKKSNFKRNVILITAVFLVVLVAAIVLLFEFLPKNKKDNRFRYCVGGDYYFVETDTSIDEYAKENDIELLFLNWYADSDYLYDTQYLLNVTDEVICLKEVLIDENGSYISQYVTSADIQIDFLEAIKESCISVAEINSVTVNYGIALKFTVAYFTYNGYNYYFNVENYIEEIYILELIETLFVR